MKPPLASETRERLNAAGLSDADIAALTPAEAEEWLAAHASELVKE